MKKIIVAGGTGFIGRGILMQLNQNPAYELISISRSGGQSENHLPHVRYLAADFNKDGAWQQELQSADWVINCVGILLENPIKHQSYEKNSLLPAIRMITTIAESDTNFLFINANAFPIKKYMDTKNTIAEFANNQLSQRAFNVYPGLVFGRERLSTYLPGKLLNWWLHATNGLLFKSYRPISRTQFAIEIEKIINHEPSSLTQRLI